MAKLKWKYDKKVNQFFILRKAYGEVKRIFQITENEHGPLKYNLFINHHKIGMFKKLSSAKKVAQLIHNG